MTKKTPPLSDYEQTQLERLLAWQGEPPGWLTRRMGQASGPMIRLAQTLVPLGALRAALEGANELALKLTQREQVLRAAGAVDLDELLQSDLARCDTIAQRVRRQAVGLSAIGGAVSGVAGAPGLVLDVPVLLTLSLHTIHRSGLCYGYDSLAESERPYAVGVFALASANTLEEKAAALAALREHDGTETAAIRDGLERAAQREFSKGAAIFSLHNLARQLGTNLARRKAASALPIVGALVGGAVNAWYLHDLAQTARYAFHARRFLERGVV